MSSSQTKTTPDWVDVHTIDEMEAFFLSVLPAVREAAKSCGYAIGFHGSARRDLDLIAVPWIEIYSTPNALATAIHKAACGMQHENGEYTWEKKPNGRIATSMPICWTDYSMPKMLSLGHIDLSVVGV